MSKQELGNKLNGRDFINIGIYAAYCYGAGYDRTHSDFSYTTFIYDWDHWGYSVYAFPYESEKARYDSYHESYYGNYDVYITHVGIYLGNNRMFHAGDPIGYADLTSPYWQQHLVGAGRIKQ